MAIVPILCRPRLLSFKNQWLSLKAGRESGGRRSIILILSALIMLTMYAGSLTVLHSLRKVEDLFNLPSSLPLSFMLLLLLGMLVFSSAVAALSTLYFSEDLELVLAAPVSPGGFFFGKLLEITASSSWTIIVFGFPILIAFGQIWGLGWDAYVFSIIVLIPYFIMPAAAAIAAVVLFTLLVPVQYTRAALLLLLLISAALIFLFLQQLSLGAAPEHSTRELAQAVAVLQMSNHGWLPSNWAAWAIGALVNGDLLLYLFLTLWLYGSLTICLMAAYLAVRFIYPAVYSRSRSAKALRLESAHSQRIASRLFGFLSSTSRAVIFKDIKTFSRDMTQAVQLMLLLGICLVYLSNFKLVRAADSFSPASQIWWKNILLLLNMGMGSFVLTAISARFIFPSISLEGKPFWILASSPLSSRRLMIVKFLSWFLVLALIATVIFAAGAFAIEAAPIFVLISILSGWLFSFSIAGMGVGMGSLFVRFDWQHVSQISTSLGNLLYMLSCIVLIVLNLVPAGILVIFGTIKFLEGGLADVNWIVFLLGSLVLILWINLTAVRWAFSSGLHTLETLEQ